MFASKNTTLNNTIDSFEEGYFEDTVSWYDDDMAKNINTHGGLPTLTREDYIAAKEDQRAPSKPNKSAQTSSAQPKAPPKQKKPHTTPPGRCPRTRKKPCHHAARHKTYHLLDLERGRRIERGMGTRRRTSALVQAVVPKGPINVVATSNLIGAIIVGDRMRTMVMRRLKTKKTRMAIRAMPPIVMIAMVQMMTRATNLPEAHLQL
jgi:hypothetical protein